MIMQSYDFLELFQKYGCNMQFGGDDQWANMLGGTELIRKKLGKDAHAMTITLLLNSSYGRAFKAIREDEIAAEAMGINLFYHKNLAFMVSAFFAGIGGGLYGALLGTVDPKNFLFTLTYNFLLIIVLGGMGSVTGSMFGAIIVTAGLEYLRVFDEPLELMGVAIPLFRPGLRMVVFSILLMICVLFWRHGIMGTNELTWEKIIHFVKHPLAGFRKKGVQGK